MLNTKDYEYTLMFCKFMTFPLQQWMYEGGAFLRYTYIAS
jgi:hypothetical protein